MGAGGWGGRFGLASDNDYHRHSLPSCTYTASCLPVIESMSMVSCSVCCVLHPRPKRSKNRTTRHRTSKIASTTGSAVHPQRGVCMHAQRECNSHDTNHARIADHVMSCHGSQDNYTAILLCCILSYPTCRTQAYPAVFLTTSHHKARNMEVTVEAISRPDTTPKQEQSTTPPSPSAGKREGRESRGGGGQQRRQNRGAPYCKQHK